MAFAEWALAAHSLWEATSPTHVAVDTETTGVAFYDVPFCATIAWDLDDGDIQSYYFELGDPTVDDALKSILTETPNLVFHNAKFDIQKLTLVNLLDPELMNPLAVHDTEALAHLLDEHRPKKLKGLARDLLGLETDEAEAIKAAKKEHKLTAKDGFDRLPREVIIPYALKDAEYTIQLYDHLWPLLSKHEDLMRLYQTEQRLTFVLLAMEKNGMALNLDYIQQTAKTYNSKALAQELVIRDMTGDEEFNPNSPKQVTEAFEKLGITVEGTGKEVLNGVDHPLAQHILSLRTLRKMHSTYLKPMLVEQRDGVIHPSFRQHGTKTGRMSSGGQESS